jgi:ABC-type Fe3+-hydroxamate transport system substrate-binding protein
MGKVANIIEDGSYLLGHVQQPPKRVISLVPSITESFFDLGLSAALVGITDFCVHPQEGVRGLTRVGGTKEPNVEAILALSPDLVIANKEENTRQVVEAIDETGIPVWLTFPQTVAQALDVLVKLGELFHSRLALEKVRTLESAVGWAQSAAANQPSVPYFCPIWQEQMEAGSLWWMTFNAQTYAHDLLYLLGGENIFAGRSRRYPLPADLGQQVPEETGPRDTRYPRVTVEEIQRAKPEIILLPDEPYAFSPEDRDRLCGLLGGVPAVENQRVVLTEGSLITWHGTRMGKALSSLSTLFIP